MSLEQASKERRARLAALKARREGKNADATAASEAPISFRSYDPTTGQARKHGREEGDHETVESRVAGVAAQIVAEDAERRAQELDLLNIQPKKPNADLKRDLERKMEKLRPQTELAINTLIRRRLAATKQSDGGQQSAEGVALARALDERTLDDASDEEM